VKAFLGLAGYYSRFVPNFAAILSPLTDLTKARLPQTGRWTEDTEAAFLALKDVLCSHRVLVTPNFSKNLLVQTDTSETGVGAVLSQEQEAEEQPIMYVSRKLLQREKKILDWREGVLRHEVDTGHPQVLSPREEVHPDH
jgi:hypothetical protein